MGRTLAEVWVAVRPDTSKTGGEIQQKLSRIDTSKGGEAAGRSFTAGFGRGIKTLAGLAAGAFAADRIVGAVKSTVDAASDMNETVSKSRNVFGASAAQMLTWSKTSATSFGLSQQAALSATSQFGDMFKQLGFTERQSASTSQSLVKTAADLGSFHNLDPTDVLERISAGFRGEYDSLQLLIPNINAARVEQEAMNLGLVKGAVDSGKVAASRERVSLAQKKLNEAIREHGRGSDEARRAALTLGTAQDGLKKALAGSKGELTGQARAQAILSILQKDGKAAAGDFAETSAGLANQQRIAAAQTENLKAKLGQALLPAMVAGATVLNEQLLPPLIDLAERHGPQLAETMTDLGPTISTALTGVDWAGMLDRGAQAMRDLGPAAAQVRTQTPALADSLRVSGVAMGFLADHSDLLAKALPFLAIGFGLVKVAQIGANAAAAVSPALRIAEVIANRRLAASNAELTAAILAQTGAARGATAAQAAETVATNGGIIARVRATAANVAHRVATVAVTVATRAWTAGQWLLNAALAANPIGLVIVAIAGLAAGIIYAYKNSETFRRIVHAAFRFVADSGRSMWQDFLRPAFSATVTALKGIGSAISTMYNSVFRPVVRTIVSTFLDMVGSVINGAARAFGWVPGLGGKLKSAARTFNTFRDDVNRSLNGVKDRKVMVGWEIRGVGAQAVAYTKSGGKIFAADGMILPSVKAFAAGGEHHVAQIAKPGDWRVWAEPETGGEAYIPLAPGKRRRSTQILSAVAGRFGMGLVPMAGGGLLVQPGVHGADQLEHAMASLDRGMGRVADALGSKVAAAIEKNVSVAGGPWTGGGSPYKRVTWRGHQFNERSVRMLLAAERLAGTVLRITQGSYSTRVAASGSTHAGGGAVDIGSPTTTAVQNAMRRVGWAAWIRTPAQGPWGRHIHGVAIGDPTLSPAAARQVASFRRGGNGLGMAAGGLLRSYDSGGWLPTGLSLAYNGTGRPERVEPEGGRREYHFHFAGREAFTARDAVEAMERAAVMAGLR